MSYNVIVFNIIFLYYLEVADTYIKISISLMQLATTEHTDLEKFLTRIAETFEKLRVSKLANFFHIKHPVTHTMGLFIS